MFCIGKPRRRHLSTPTIPRTATKQKQVFRKRKTYFTLLPPSETSIIYANIPNKNAMNVTQSKVYLMA